MTTIEVEAGVFADIIKRAATVAPTRGDGLDKAAGIVMRVDVSDGTLTVMSTDTLTFFMEVMSCSISEGNSVFWRIPSQVFAQTVSKMQNGTGKRVKLSDATPDGRIVTSQGRMKASFNVIPMTHYNLWDAVDESQLEMIPDLGALIKQVNWAKAGNKEIMLNGVMIGDGWIGASDRYRAALVRTSSITSDRFLIPTEMLSSIVPERGDVKVGRIGNKFVCMPSPTCQIETGIRTEVPDLTGIFTRKTLSNFCTFSRSELLPMIERLIGFANGDRQARASIYVGRGQIALYLDNSEVGVYGDIVDAAGDAENHERIKIELNPINLRDAISAYPAEVVRMEYNVKRDRDSGKMLAFNCPEKNYNSIIAPLAEPPQPAENQE